MSARQQHPSAEPQAASVWPFLSGCLLLVLIGSGFSAWKFETPIHATLIHSELGLDLQGGDWWAGFLTVWGKSLWLALPVLGLVWLLRRSGRVRLSAVLFDLSVALLACWLVMDLYLMTLTRTHVLDYAGFAVQRSAWEWAGRSSAVLSRLGLLFGVMVFAVTMVCVPVAILIRRTTLHVRPAVMRRLGVTLAVVYAMVLIGSAANVGRSLNSPSPLLTTLLRQLPVRVLPDRTSAESTNDAQFALLRESIQEAYAESFPELAAGRPIDSSIRIAEENRRDVVIFVLESLRHDAFDRQTMPRLCELSREGLVCERHYAGGNASHFGLFSLLYGRSALAYEPTLNAGVPPQLCATLRASGYELSFITSGSCDEWRRMGEYLNESVFNRLETIEGETWVDRDRAALARVEELLADGERPPQFVVAFLMSTHFNYEFPPEFARHEPYARNVSLFTLGEREGLWNRYRNAAGFLDDEVARTIGGLDLDRTVVAVTGDHGESLLDDGQMFHGSRLSEIQTRVPCLLLGADVPVGVVPTLTSHVDLTPTLIDVLNRSPTRIAGAHGVSFLTAGPNEASGVLLVQPPFGTQRDPEFNQAAVVTDRLRVQCRLSLREGAVDDVRLIDERGQSRSSVRLTGEELSELVGAIQAQMRRLGGARKDVVTGPLTPGSSPPHRAYSEISADRGGEGRRIATDDPDARPDAGAMREAGMASRIPNTR